jgi:hypothetical protein
MREVSSGYNAELEVRSFGFEHQVGLNAKYWYSSFRYTELTRNALANSAYYLLEVDKSSAYIVSAWVTRELQPTPRN